jgi:TonB-linked SusC/RagA family outer membrane protein
MKLRVPFGFAAPLRSVFLLFLPLLAFSQTRTLQGRVTLGATADPAVGATVQVKGAGSGVVTDLDGRYSISVPGPDAVLVFSYLGFVTQEVAAGNGPALDLVLQEDASALKEVIVTALGIKKEKAKLGYAAQEISGEPLRKATEANVATSLTGRVSGLAVSTKSTLYENPQILLRGKATLVVVDGVPTKTDFWNISADDIESLSVLKGTAAAALYGALGINGAIMITTKKGKSDGKDGVEVTLNSSTQLHAGFIRIPETQDQYGMGWNGQYAFVDGRGGGTFDDYGYVYGPKLNQRDPSTASGFVEIPQYNSSIDPATGQRVPLPWITRSKANLRKFLRNEMLTTNNVSVAGKGERGDYRISLSHLFQRGQVPNTELNSTTASLAGGLKVSKRIKAEATVSYNRQYSPNYPSAGYGADNYFYNILLWMGPDVDVNDLRNYWQPGKEDVQQLTYNYTWYNNPWYLANEYLKQYTNDVVLGQANLTWDFTDHLKFMVRSGITTSNVFTDRKTPYSFIYYSSGASPLGNYNVERSNSFQVISDALLTYSRSFNEDWELTLSAGASHRFNSFSDLRSNTVGLNIPGHFNLSNSISPVQTFNNLQEKEVSSAYGYADLGYKRMVYLGFTGRNDRTSALQKPYNSFFYPSATAAVVLSEMLPLPKWFSYLKVRGAWANVSTDPDPYYTLPTYSTGTRWAGNLSLALPGGLIAPDIKPNQTLSQEYGAELKFAGNRVGIDFTYFTYNDRNFIIEAPVSLASGYNSRLVNGGEVNRRGAELTLTATPIKRGTLRWDLTANLSRAHSYRSSYYGGDTLLDGVKIGERIDVYRGWAWQRSPDGKIVTANGRPQYIDHVINLGHLDPDLVFGIGSQISWKGFTLGFLIDGRVGGKMYNGVEAKLYEGGMHPGTANKFRDESYAGEATWLLEGVEVADGAALWDEQGRLVSDTRRFVPNATKVKYIDHLFDTYVNGIDEAVLYDRTFAKLREVTLTYVLPAAKLRKTPFKEANISIIGRNLLLWSKVPFMDPDGYTGLSLAEPTYRNVGVNLNFKF